MKRALLVLLVLVGIAGCRPHRGGPPEGAATAEKAVRQFLDAAAAQDIQAVSAVWGNERGPVRDHVARQELERRIIVMICHLRQTESRIGDSQLGEGGRLMYRVEVTKKEKKATPTFSVVQNRDNRRWFVYDFDIAALEGFCQAPQPSPGEASGTR